jgi:hypothetical protein
MRNSDRWTDGSMKTLEELVTRCVASGGRAELRRVVIQDEYTHDFIVRDGERWLVYDGT